MTKKIVEVAQLEALLDGLEAFVLQPADSERMAVADSMELSRSMQFILAASAARAKLDAVAIPKVRNRSGLKKSAAIKLSELRSLLAPRSTQLHLAAALEGDEQVDEKRLNSLIEDVERIMTSKRDV